MDTKRIGHGLTLVRNQKLIDRVKKQDVCVELNPLSNYLLGYVRDLHWHPAKILIQNGVKVSISPDDFLNWDERGVTADHFLLFLYCDFDLKDIKWCLLNSIQYSAFSEDEKKKIGETFASKWESWLDIVNQQN